MNPHRDKKDGLRGQPGRRRGGIAFVFIACLAGSWMGSGTVWSAVLDPLDSEPDDRLPRRERELAAGLIQRGMPELVEALLNGHPPMHRVYLARAYVRAGIESAAPSMREEMFTRGAKEYRRLIQLGRDPDWLIGERRRFHVAQWRVELGDLILRYWIAPDLDRFEITSGLAFDRDRLSSRLAEAREAYVEAGRLLSDLDVGVRTDEERYLLLGIAGRISQLSAQRELNNAWAVLYQGLILEPGLPDRRPLLDEALVSFDRISGSATDEKRKYNALLGAGIALRESGRFDEAEKAFDRILRSTAPRALGARARYEQARSMILEGRYEDARRELDALAVQPERRYQQRNSGALFYIRLAPLIRAYSYLHEARALQDSEAGRDDLLEKARAELVELTESGGDWGNIVQVYLDALSGKKREPGELTDAELLIRANERMSNGDYGEAIRIWRILLGRESAMPRHVEARFNLGVCLFQTRALRPAAEAFLTVVRSDPPARIADRAYFYAYRCWRQLAAESRRREDYLQLGEAARLFAAARPGDANAAEAEWVAALALEEAGEYRRALAAYARLTPASPKYWRGRRNAARCRQRLYESLSQSATSRRRERHAKQAVEAWLKLADDLSAATGSKGGVQTSGPSDQQGDKGTGFPLDTRTRQGWIRQARLAAASLLAGDDLRDYKGCLALLEPMVPGARVLGLQIRCLQGLGEIKEANRVMESFLKQGSGGDPGPVLVGLAAEMESEIDRLERIGHRREARRLAVETLPTIRRLLEWIRSRPEHATHVPIVQYSLIQTLIRAGMREEAVGQLDDLMSAYPNNGVYVRTAARLQERVGASSGSVMGGSALDRAESLWAKLLGDPKLLEGAPEAYWEARYHWLRHQLRRGKNREVVQGIRSEQAWRPDLGGPPWQGRILELMEQAQATREAATP